MSKKHISTIKIGIYYVLSTLKCTNRNAMLIRLVQAIDSTIGILNDLRTFNKDSWIMRYPQFNDPKKQGETSTSHSRPSVERRTMSFADDPQRETDVVLRRGLKRSISLAMSSPPDEAKESSVSEEDDKDSLLSTADFHVLRLDLKLGPHGSSSSPASLVSQLEKSSIANLLDERIISALKHVDKLRLRIEDTSSKVLVTGDLNAGKSTLVNALLRREVMPVDQQPCTTAFCEVHDAAENDGLEEIHIVKEDAIYNIKDETTFSRAKFSDLEDIISENENAQKVIKIYMSDDRSSSDSFLNNGIVDISLIDAPGLNRDSVKTTALFARQEEIDVVVFVVSAENHFTLSAREFLVTASNEKAYIFIVVNKYDQIRDKNKCRRVILGQVKEVSPGTFEDAEDLVHFVDSSAVLGSDTVDSSFDNLESSLRSFVLIKRSKSKLNPAATYLSKLLFDIDLLSGANAILAQTELDRAKEDLNRARPMLEMMKNGCDGLEEGLVSVEEESVKITTGRARDLLVSALERVGRGELGIDKALVSMPSYPGLFGIWDYVRDVRKAFLTSLDLVVKLAEDEARVTTTNGVNSINLLSDKYLPPSVDRTRRVFMPEAMFSQSRAAKGGKRMRRSGVVVAGGYNGLGLGLVQRPDLLETTFFDLFDVQHHLSVYFGDNSKEISTDEESLMPSALGIVSVGFGALTVAGGNVIGIRSLIEGAIRLSEIFSSESARKWVAPVLGAATIGLTVYFVLELPSTVPRTVGRRIRTTLAKAEDGEESFTEMHAGRVGRETRKVLRIASWEARERFRAAMEDSAKEVRGAEESERRASHALGWFTEVSQRTGNIRSEAGLMKAL